MKDLGLVVEPFTAIFPGPKCRLLSRDPGSFIETSWGLRTLSQVSRMRTPPRPCHEDGEIACVRAAAHRSCSVFLWLLATQSSHEFFVAFTDEILPLFP